MRLIVILIFLCGLIISSYAQRDPLPLKEVYQSKFDENKMIWKSPVLVRTYPIYLDNQTYRIYFLIEIQYDFLQYLYNDEEYTADTEFEINITNRSTNQLQSRILKSKFYVDDFKTTNRKDLFHFTLDSLEISSGRYEVTFKYRDVNGKGTQHIYKFDIHLPEVDQFNASSVLFCYPGKQYKGEKEIFNTQPSALRSYWDFNKELGIQLNSWQEEPGNPLKINFSIIDEEDEKSLFDLDTLITGNSKNKSIYFDLSKNLFLEKEYLLDITYFTSNDTIEHKFPLKIVWFNKPRSLWNIKFAIEPIQYLLEDEKEYDNFIQGNDKQLRNKFQEFWKERDPTPDTPFNELQYEFYSRVDSANVKFSRKRSPGWRTDIGKIYILYGEPDEVVDNSLAPISNPFLRWIYNLNDKQLSFTFLAVDGRKRYKLENVEENPL